MTLLDAELDMLFLLACGETRPMAAKRRADGTYTVIFL